MPAPIAEFEAAVETLFRDAELLGGVLLLDRTEPLSAADREPHLEALLVRVAAARGTVILCGERPCDPRFTTLVPVAFQEPGYEERKQTWSAALARERVSIDSRALQELATRYRLDSEQIDRAVALSARQAALEAPARPVDLADLTLAAREQMQRDPGSLARKLRSSIPWERLVLPADQLAQLRELCQHARFRHVVFGQWGFERKLSTGKGLSALFSGPPGTGKTMAAEVIASDLGLDLYKIDLSQVVSKYIGETEKNMDKLFTEARLANAILFFDECDALFGKRTTVQDAHDRYANIEISYLLQKMDEYEGLSILATNLRQNLDAAFVRRLNFIIEFPFPDESSRRRIWETIWPDQLPRSRDLDLEFMAAQFKLPGGAVRNIAVAAAFLAAGGKGEVTTEHLLRATRRELEKAGRSVSRTEYGRYADLVAPAAAAAVSGGRT